MGSDRPAESEQSAVKIHFSILLGVSGQNKLSSLALLTCTTLLLPGPCPAPGAWAQRPHTAPAAKAQGQVRVGRQACPQSCLGGPGHCCPLCPPLASSQHGALFQRCQAGLSPLSQGGFLPCSHQALVQVSPPLQWPSFRRCHRLT